MNNKDQFLLEAAYQEVSNKVKDLYDQIIPLAEKILGNEKMVSWDLDEEDKNGELKHYTKFCLKRTIMNAGSSKATPTVEFGNLHGGEFWGNALSPYATTPKKYETILKVLKKKVNPLKESSSFDEEQDFSYYTGPSEDVMFLDDINDISNLKRKVQEGKHFKTVFVANKADAVNYGYPDESGFKFYVFYTPQDFARPALIPV